MFGPRWPPKLPHLWPRKFPHPGHRPRRVFLAASHTASLLRSSFDSDATPWPSIRIWSIGLGLTGHITVPMDLGTAARAGVSALWRRTPVGGARQLRVPMATPPACTVSFSPSLALPTNRTSPRSSQGPERRSRAGVSRGQPNHVSRSLIVRLICHLWLALR
jgi:hypothetical protein